MSEDRPQVSKSRPAEVIEVTAVPLERRRPRRREKRSPNLIGIVVIAVVLFLVFKVLAIAAIVALVLFALPRIVPGGIGSLLRGLLPRGPRDRGTFRNDR